MKRSLLITLVTSLSVVSFVFADSSAASFQYEVDYFEVNNTRDDFDDGVLDPWIIEYGTAIETSGFVKLSNPGQVETQGFGYITIESSEIFTNDASFIVSSDADFVATSKWKAVIPNVNQGFQMKLDIHEQVGPDDLEIFYIELYNIGSISADYFGVEEGLYVIFDRYNPNGIRFEEQQLFHIDNPNPSEGILLSMSYNHIANQITGEFSLDGGQSFNSPFSPIAAHLDEGIFDDWELNGFSREFEVVPEPCKYLLEGDLNRDCRIDLTDFSIMASKWLIDCNDFPLNPACHCDIPWVAEPPMNVARDQFAGGVINGKIYVFGGNGNPDGNNLDSTEMYDPVIAINDPDVWSIVASNSHAVEELTAAVVNDKLYVFGSSSSSFNQMYDPATDTWEPLPEKPTLTRGGPTTVYNNKIYTFGGWFIGYGTDDPNLSNVVECFDPNSETWQPDPVTIMEKELSNLAIATIGTKAYLFGGMDWSDPSNPQFHNKVITYDFDENTWDTIGDVDVPAGMFHPNSTAAPIIDGKVYLIGRREIEAMTYVYGRKVDIYDPTTNTWEEGTPLPMPLSDHLILNIGSKIYVLGGDRNENFYNRAKTDVISYDTDHCSH